MKCIVALVLAVAFLAAPVLVLACDHPKTTTLTVPQICEKLGKADEMLSTERATNSERHGVLVEGLRAVRQIYNLPPAVRKIAYCGGVAGFGLSFGNNARVEHFVSRLLSGAIPAGVDVSAIFTQAELLRFAAHHPYSKPPDR